jgi:uncharacterized repeat protein (TIGR01451 family)
MFKYVLGLVMVSSLTLLAMGPTVNYDEQFDREEQVSISEDINQRLSGLKLSSLVFQEQVIHNSKGESIKKKIPVTTVLKGSKVVYINRLINRSSEEKKDIVVKNPIPSGAEYVVGSATCNGGCSIYFSTDGGVTFSKEEQSGKIYTNLEFYFSKIEAQQERRMGFRAIIK